MGMRIERDTMGEILVEETKLWGAQTQRSVQNFNIGWEQMPEEIIMAFAVLKKACAFANFEYNKLTSMQSEEIANACDAILGGEYNDQFPLKIWQTGSGTQSNMNVNEVIAHICNNAGGNLHPNDHVNMSQSSNDTFPTAMNVAAVLKITNHLLPAINKLIKTLEKLENDNQGIIKIGRTHLQDATPISFSQEISGWRAMIEENYNMIVATLPSLRNTAIGGTAVGTGLNSPKEFGDVVAKHMTKITSQEFYSSKNKFHALTSKDAFVFSHGAIKALACNLMKIANDIRWLASGPRCAIGEITIPENEPGSSIMPGKVNPTQCEAVTMVAVQVMGNDTAVSIAASQGNFQLNVFMPVCAYNFLQSVQLLGDVITSFNDNCLVGLKANEGKMQENLNQSLMLVTCLTPKIGYENAAFAAKTSFLNNTTLKQTVVSLGLLTESEYDESVNPQLMI